MPLYEVTAPDGNTYEIEGPEGASERDLILAAKRYAREQRSADINRRLQELRNAPPPPPETTIGGYLREIPKGLGRGAIGLAETAGAGAAALLPDELEKQVRGGIKSLTAPAKEYLAARPGYEEAVSTRLAEGLGSTLPFFLMGPLGALGRIGAGGLGIAAGAGEAREAAEAKGATAEQRRAATLLGAPTGLLDILAPEIKPFKSLVGTALLRGGVEGATEAAQKVAQNLIARGVYDPSQEILTGAGEEGAYGAGVGALASLILDMTVGRKARRAALDAGALPPPPPPPAAPLALGYTAAPFQPVVAPDGSVLATPEDVRAYEENKRAGALARAADLRTTEETARGRMTPEQAAFARESKQKQLEETFGQAQPDLFGEITAAPEPVAAPEAAPAPVADERQRDMINEMEQQQIEEMLAQPSEAEISQAARERMEFESGIETLNNMLQGRQEKTTEQNRLAVLLPIIENPAIQNIQPAFEAELRRQGFTDTKASPAEQKLIDRANDVRAAEPAAPAPAPAPEVEPSAPSDLSEMEGRISERKETREPQQIGIPGVGKRLAPAEPEPAPAPEPQFATVLTPEVLDKTGLSRQSGFYRQLVNKDMADPAQQPAVADVLVRVRSNPNLSEATKTAIERVAMQAFGGLAKQGEMFGPRGGVLEAAKEKPDAGRKQRGADSGTVGAGVGVGTTGGRPSTQPPKPPAPPTDTTGTEAPKPGGLGTRRKPTGVAKSRKGTEPSALSEADQAALQAELDQELGQTAPPAPPPPPAPPAPAPKPSAPKPPAPAPKPSAPAPSPAPKKSETGEDHTYLEVANNNFDKALDYLAADIYNATYPEKYESRTVNEINQKLVAGEMPDIKFGKEYFMGVPGTGGKYAKAFYNSLTPEQIKALIKRLEYYFLTWQQRTNAFMESVNASQAMRRAVEEGRAQEGAPKELPADQITLTMPLHPLVVDVLKGGNLFGALRLVAAQQKGRVASIAQRLSDAIGSTKVEFRSNLKNESGKPVAGMYDPKTDTIYLDPETGTSMHVLLHEVTHAATSHILDNPNHPLTKRLNQLFKSVKGSLDTAYGAQSLDEFVSEAFSNPDFQAKLSAINPMGEPISAWQRFTHAIRTFFRAALGMEPKSIDSALDAADALINDILSPAPDTRDAGILYSATLSERGGAVLNALGARAASLPGMNSEWADRVHEFFTGSAPNAMKNVVRSALPLNALVDVAKKYIPMAPKLDVLVGEKSGAESRRNQMIEPVINYVENWARKNKGKLDNFNDVVYTSTVEQVDPSKPRATYAKDADKLKEWDALQSKWNALGSEGQTVYKLMRDTYTKMYNDVRDVINGRIDASVQDKETAKKLKTEIYQRLFASGHIEPYFPLTRTGKHWLSYNAVDPRTGNMEFYVEAFETSRERDRAIKELQADKAANASDIQKFANLNQINYRRAPPTSFINGVLRTLEANKVNNEVTEEVMRLFLNTLPETSFAQSFRRRKGTLGFKHDAVGALRTKTFSLSRQLSNMEYGQKMEQLRTDMRDYVRSQGNKEEAVDYLNELDQRIDYAISPSVPAWSKLATSFGFNMTLGFNVSSALINMSQIPLVVMPYLGGKYGFATTTVALGRAARIFGRSGFDREVEMLVPTDKGEKKVKVKAFPSIDNLDFNAKENADIKHLQTLVDVAGARGQLNRSQMYDVLDVDGSDNLLTKVNAASGFVFHHAERMNRQVALVAAYELELNRMRKEGRKLDAAAEREAADYAVYVTELTNGGTAAAAAPRIAQGPIGKVLFMYKRYGVSMYYMMFKTAREALASEDKKVRHAAMKQIAGIYASSALMAGAQGIPMFGIVAMLYDLFTDDDEDDFKTAARKWMGETMYTGLGNNVFGVELASRFGLSDLLFRDSVVKDQQSVMASLMETMGGPVIGVASRIERGLKLIGDGNVERGIEQMLPSAIANGFKAYRYGTEGARTLRGDPITSDIGPWNVFAQAFGFAPAEYVRQLEINSNLKKIERAATEERTKLLRKYYVAMREGDGDTMASTMEKMMDFNKRHPTDAITPTTIKNSMRQHMRTTAEMYHGVTINKKLRPELMANAGEYDAYLEED